MAVTNNNNNAVTATVGCLLWLAMAAAAVNRTARLGGRCDGVLEWPADGSRDVYCDVVPRVIDVSRVRGLTALDVSRNQLDGIRVVSDVNVTLSALDLSGNAIADACRVYTGPAVRVDALVLSHNDIGNFTVCSDATNLTYSWNRIGSLDRTDTANASSVQVLDLGNNVILWIEDDAFAGMPDLRWLDLSGNALTTMSDNSASPGAVPRRPGHGGLDRTAAAFRPFDSLVRLNAAGRAARLAPAAVLVGAGPRLQALDASRTGLTRVPVAPAPLLGSLTLSGNAIAAVNGGDLDGFPLLRVLNMSGNLLATVEDDAFGRLDMLAVLDLSGNLLAAVPRSLPAGLETLDLADNRIRGLAADDFDGCTRLRTLNVRGNGIRAVQDATFAALVYLDALDLSDNPIGMITREMLTGPVRLRTLKLESVAAPDTPAFPFTDTRYLNRLQLAHSGHLAAILLNDSAVLASMSQLEHLDLTGCPATALLGRLPDYMPKMRTLALSERLRCADASPWLGDWLCQMRSASESTSVGRRDGGTALRLINRGRQYETRDDRWSADDVRCTRDDDGRTQPVLDARRCERATTTTTAAAAAAAAAAATGTGTATAAASPSPSGATGERAQAVFARFRAEHDANSSRAAAETTGPAAIASLLLLALAAALAACGIVCWIAVAGGDSLKRLHWRRSAADVDYQSIEIKSMESLNRVERW